MDDPDLPKFRAEAMQCGASLYMTGKPCKHGHLAARRTHSRKCVACESAENARRYRADPAPYKARAALRRETKPAQVRAEIKRWEEANAEWVKAYTRARTQRNQEKGLARLAKWTAENPDRERARHIRWKGENIDIVRVHTRNRRARKKSAPGTHTAEDVEWLMTKQRGKCAHSWCRKSLKNGHHVDHVLPLALGGSNDRSNLQLLCESCNCSKGAKHPIQFAQQHGLLL
jgi:5-methylcytosine-specific restriction endonuclease McrA